MKSDIGCWEDRNWLLEIPCFLARMRNGLVVFKYCMQGGEPPNSTRSGVHTQPKYRDIGSKYNLFWWVKLGKERFWRTKGAHMFGLLSPNANNHRIFPVKCITFETRLQNQRYRCSFEGEYARPSSPLATTCHGRKRAFLGRVDREPHSSHPYPIQQWSHYPVVAHRKPILWREGPGGGHVPVPCPAPCILLGLSSVSTPQLYIVRHQLIKGATSVDREGKLPWILHVSALAAFRRTRDVLGASQVLFMI